MSYFLVRRLLGNNASASWIGVITAFFLAISPWHINLSRAAFEANVATFLIVTATYCFIYALQEKPRFIILSATLYALTFYTFNTPRIFIPLFVLFLAIYFRRQILKIQKEVIISGITGFIIIAPLMPFLFSPQASLRFKEVNIFSDPDLTIRSNQEIENSNNSLLGKALLNRRVTYIREYLIHYFDNFNPTFLFISGDENERFSTQDVGQMYILDAVLVIAGIVTLIRGKKGYTLLLFMWVLIGIIPAATARETPHALRIETTLPMFQLFAAAGFYAIYMYVYKKWPMHTSKFLIFSVIIISLQSLYYLYGYYRYYPQEYSKEWQYGYKQLFNYLKTVDSKYDEIRISDNYGRPYIYYLFYNKIDPIYFRKYAIVERDIFGFVKVREIGKYKFVDSIRSDEQNQRILFAEIENKNLEGYRYIKDITLLNNRPIFRLYEN